MGYVTWRIDHTPYVNNTWNPASTTTLTSFYDPIVTLELGDARDSFSFKVTNFNGVSNNKFNANDKLLIYRVVNSETVNTATDLLIHGVLREPSMDVTAGQNMVRVEGYSYSEFVLGALFFGDYQNIVIPTAISTALANVAGQATNFKVSWDSVNNPTVRSDGSAFPVVGQMYSNKPLRDMLEKVSTHQATGDGNYYYYVTTDNKFRWFRGSNASTKTLSYNIDEIKSMKYNVDTSKIVNFVILKGGKTPDGRQISGNYIDQSSFAKHGRKPYIMVDQNNYADTLRGLDYLASWGNTQQNTNYPNLSASFTTSWRASFPENDDIPSEVVEGVTVVKGSTIEIDLGSEAANKKAYNAILKREVLSRMRTDAARYIEDVKFGVLKLTVEFFPGHKDWGLGDNVICAIAPISSAPLTLRVRSITYSSTSDSYYLEEDIGTR